jgi:hypothetical protein
MSSVGWRLFDCYNVGGGCYWYLNIQVRTLCSLQCTGQGLSTQNYPGLRNPDLERFHVGVYISKGGARLQATSAFSLAKPIPLSPRQKVLDTVLESRRKNYKE